MKKELARLNFNIILKYPQVIGYKNSFPYKCNGFCIACEENNVFKKEEKLVYISHAADSSDYKKVSKKEYKYNIPIMFVFENPGANEKYELGKYKTYRKIKKYVPINHYYWINKDKIEKGINNVNELIDAGLYGPYIYYLHEKYQLNNIYVTNLTKCKLIINKNGKEINGKYSHVRKFCVNNIFKNELKLFKPEIVICMGNFVYKHFPRNLVEKNIYKARLYLYHPAAHMSDEDIIIANEKYLNKKLPKILKY
jgi:hypothetical protein